MRAAFVAGLMVCVTAGHVAVAENASGSPASAPALTRDDLEAWLDGYVPYALQRGDVAGAVVVVARDGEVLLQKGYGYADVAAKKPMDPERTSLGVGSVSKLFTWTAVMQQVERGKLDLDRDVNEYLDVQIPRTYDEPITLRHLMTHTAGFEEQTFRVVPEGEAARPLREYIQQTSPPDRIYAPGERQAYSNYGSMLAGYLVERVTGERFVPYVQKHILDALDMRHSTFERPTPAPLRDSLALSYEVASGPPYPPENEEPSGDPSGHLITSAADIAHFMLAHLQEGRFSDTALLRPETTRLMHTPTYTPIPGGNPVALGFFRMDYNGREVLTHPGVIAGYHADLALLPGERIGFFMAINSDGAPVGAFGAGGTLRQALFRHFLDRYFPAPAAMQQATASTAQEHAKLAAGEYRMTRRHGGDFMEAVELITRYFAVPVVIAANADGTITTPGWISFENGRPKTWREIAPFRWQHVGGSAHLNMRVENGEVVEFFPDDILGAWTNERVSTIESAGLNVPLFVAASGVIALATLMWPVAALTRRHYGVKTPLVGDDARADRWTHIAVAIAALHLLGWFLVLAAGIPSQVGAEPWIRLVQLVGLASVVGTAAAVWNVLRTWRRRGGAWSKAWSVVVALALIELAWFSFAFHLISINITY